MNGTYTAATVEPTSDNDNGNELAPPMDPPEYVYKSKLTEFLWTLPQPLIALSAMTAVAYAITSASMTPEALSDDADALTMFLLFSPLLLLLAAERIWTKKQAWLLNWRDYAEDAFWIFTAAYIWVPLITDYYSTPIESAFEWIKKPPMLEKRRKTTKMSE